MNSKYYVYAHFKHGDEIPFYIGKGKDSRAYSKDGRSKWWHRTVSKHGLRVELLAEQLSESAAFAIEMDRIAAFGRRDLGQGPLCNLTNGGEGAAGTIMSDETKAKIGFANKGKVCTPEAKLRIAAAAMGHNRNVGRIPDNAQRATNSASQQARAIAKGRLPGTCLHVRGKWQACIMIAGKKKHLGVFLTEQQAHEAFLAAKSTLNTEVRDDIAS